MNMGKIGAKMWCGKTSVNDWILRYIGLRIVWGWLAAALGIVAMGVSDPSAVMPMLGGCIALLAIVGTLATLIVTSMLELCEIRTDPRNRQQWKIGSLIVTEWQNWKWFTHTG